MPQFFLVIVYLFLINGNVCTYGDTLQKLSASLETELPHCHFNVDGQANYRTKELKGKTAGKTNQVHSEASCWNSWQLMPYDAKRAVKCLDVLYQEQIFRNTKNLLDQIYVAPVLNFVFIGDSRIRQQFFNFLRLIPDYDRKTKPDPMPFFVHEDMQFTSKILGLSVSFFWRPVINDNVTETLRQWTINFRSVANWIVINMEVHHMLQENGGDYTLYQEQLSKLIPILEQLAISSQIIWVNQYPTIDTHHLHIFSEKIYFYNNGIRGLLRNRTAIKIWDSSNSLAEEYIRSCAVYPQRESKGEYTAQYFACKDYIHTGNSALFQATQLLFNNICETKF